MDKVSTCLWFAREGEAAVRRYVSLVPDSRIERVQRSPAAWPGGEAGDVILVLFTLGGQSFQALNGGEPADYGMAAALSVSWAADGGQEIACGWLRDRWGVPWQIVPEVLPRLLADPAVSGRVFAAMQTMVKLDVAALERAAEQGLQHGA